MHLPRRTPVPTPECRRPQASKYRSCNDLPGSSQDPEAPGNPEIAGFRPVRGRLTRTGRRRLHGRVATIAALLLLPFLPACQAVGPAFGATAAQARANGEAFFEAFANRYTNVERDAHFSHARARIARYALSPSVIFGDTAVWNGGSNRSRTLLIEGVRRQNRYRFASQVRPADLTTPGDSRHLVSLTHLGDDVYRWGTNVDMAVGGVSPHELQDVWLALLWTAEQRSSTGLRTDYRRAFPRTTQALGRMLTLDSLVTRRMADGSTFIMLVTSMHPDRVQQSGFPRFGRYLEKYFGPARYTISLTNGNGVRWVDATLHGKSFLFQLRVKDGRLLALDGTSAELPTTSVIEMDAHAKVGIFGVGVSELKGELTQISTAAERGWLFRFREEPKWDFPLSVNRLIRTSLRRPFADDGVTFRMSAVRTESGDRQTIINRRLNLVVQESTIVRWLGNLGFTAMDDFQGEVEDEESRFLAEAFRALSEDIGALGR